MIDELSLSDQEKLVAIMEAGCDEVSDIDDLINLTFNLDCYDIMPGINDESDLATITPTKLVSTLKRISVLWQTTSTMNAMGATLRWMSRDASADEAMSVSQANAGTGSSTASLTIFPTNTGLPAQVKPPSMTAPSLFLSSSRERSLM